MVKVNGRFVLVEMPVVANLGPSYAEAVQRFVRDALLEEAFCGRIVCYAWEDEHPEGTDLLDVAAREVRAEAERRGVEIMPATALFGRRWVAGEDGQGKPGPFGWVAEAIITGRIVR
jgi:hypothetical protein